MFNVKIYQKAYNEVEKKLKNNSQVIAIVVYGSIITGDIWEDSDIDFIVITKEQNVTDNIFTRSSGVSIHIYYVSKNIFINSYQKMLKGGTFHKAFFTGKLVYCVDDEIKDIHDMARFYGDKDRNARNIEIMCHILNSLHYTKKYLATGKIETSYQWCVEAVSNYARLLMNLKGHITDKDILSFAVSIDDEIEKLFEILNGSQKLKDKISMVIEIIENYININIEDISDQLIKFLKNKNRMYSVEEIKNIDEFKQIDGDLNLLLVRLSRMKIIKEGTRPYTSYGDEYLIDEIVYYM